MKKKQRTNQFKSDEELYFSWWLDELKKHGVVLNWRYEHLPYLLSPAVDEVVGGKVKNVLKAHSYTPDFEIMWSLKYTDKVGIKLRKEGIMSSIVDIKGEYARNFNDTAFPINQKWMFYKYGLYVNKVIPVAGFRINSKKQKVLKKCLFSETFTPKKYLLTATGKQRVIHWKVRTIEQFLEDIKR